MCRVTQSRYFILLNIILFILAIDAGHRRILPTSVQVREGEDVQVHFLNIFENEISCYVKTPNHTSCNLKLADNEKGTGCERIHYWSLNGTCGFYITNVQKNDSGWWRLTSQNNMEKKMSDIAQIEVLDKFEDGVEKVELLEGYTFDLSFDDTDNYCTVQNPHDEEKTVLNNNCEINVSKVGAVNEGIWSATVGIKGKIEEAIKIKNVTVFQDRLHHGYTISSDPKALHLFCNLISQDSTLSLCRFTRYEISQVGLRLQDGLRKGRYGYHGNGLAQGECGLTIESVEEKDYGHWYCMVHTLQQRYAATIEVLKPTDRTLVKNAAASSFSTSISPVITTVGETLKLQCSSNVPLSYCRFFQPSKDDISPQMLTNTSFLSDKKPLALGDCTIVIDAKKEHNGTWTCYMGPASLGMEISQEIAVRVAETSLAALDKFVFNAGNDTVILQCKTVPRAKALSYCRFHSPHGFGINIDEHITKNNSIERDGTRYWYNGKSIKAGDCGLVIEHPSSMDKGNWTCAAKLALVADNIDVNLEAFDTIYFAYESTSSEGIMSFTAGAAAGIGFGVIAVLVAVGFSIIIAKKKLHNLQSNQDADSTAPSYQEFLSLNTVTTGNTNSPRNSASSNGSNNGSNNNSSNSSDSSVSSGSNTIYDSSNNNHNHNNNAELSIA